MKAVRFERYGGPEVLEIAEVEDRLPGPGQVLVGVVAAGLNPGEIAIREGRMHERFPAHFPEGQGSDFVGVVSTVGEGVTSVAPGDDVIGLSDGRDAQAQYVIVDATRVVPKPALLTWDAAGGLPVAATTAEACLRAVDPQPGETVIVAGAAGGVGYLAAQLARLAGARVLGIASDGNAQVLRDVGVEPIPYGAGLADRLRSAAREGSGRRRADALIDCHGDGYVALGIELGIRPSRIDTIIDVEGARRAGAHADGMSTVTDPAPVLERIAALIADGSVRFPVRARMPFDLVREAYGRLESGHGHGKVVLMFAGTA